MKPSRSQHTLSELMGLVALCAIGLALLTTRAAPFGVGVLIIIPGFVLERVKGGTGMIGGIISGCFIPMVVMSAWDLIEHLSGARTTAQMLDLFPALYLTFVVCLVWSSLASGLVYVLDRALQKGQRSSRVATGVDPTGIRFLPSDVGPTSVPGATPGPSGSKRRQGR